VVDREKKSRTCRIGEVEFPSTFLVRPKKEKPLRNINIVNDVVAPITVSAVDIIIETTKPEWVEYTDYGMTALGYVGAWMGWGGPFLKNIGIASMPITARSIYNRIKGGAVSRPVSRRLAFRPSTGVSRAVTTNKPEFQGNRVI
jgi:hypothetical protein